ncbi:hypothetical protein, partial [Simiduia curdlanivorans]
DVTNGGAGSHGGAAAYYEGRTSNLVYGDYKEPTHYGVGGRYLNSENPHAYNTRGGGSIKVVADTLTLDGLITANGGSYATTASGTGAGGSIWLDIGTLRTDVISNTTRVTAKGGQSNTGPAGGGGRVAVYFDAVEGINVATQMFAEGGVSHNYHIQYGSPGTVYSKNKITNEQALRFENIGAAIDRLPTLDLSGDYTGIDLTISGIQAYLHDITFKDFTAARNAVIGSGSGVVMSGIMKSTSATVQSMANWVLSVNKDLVVDNFT